MVGVFFFSFLFFRPPPDSFLSSLSLFFFVFVRNGPIFFLSHSVGALMLLPVVLVMSDTDQVPCGKHHKNKAF